MANAAAVLLALVLSSPFSGSLEQLNTSHFQLLFAPGSRQEAEKLAPLLEQELKRVAGLFRVSPGGKLTVVLAEDQESFSALQGRAMPPWISGTARPEKSLIFLRPLLGREVRHSSLRAVAAHEIAHVLLYRKLGSRPPPRWLDEGLAVFAANEPFLSRADRLSLAALTGRFIPFRDLEQTFPWNEQAAALAYAQAGDFARFLFNQDQGASLLRALSLMAQGKSVNDAFSAAFGKGLFDLETAWRKRARLHYGLYAVVVDGAFLWFLISLLAVFASVKAMRRKRAAQRQAFSLASSEPEPRGWFSGGPWEEPGPEWEEPEEDDEEWRGPFSGPGLH